MEAVGAGGKELLFQVGPKNGWIAKAYANSVPYPFANILAQDLFQKAALIPSDTDFRVYNEFGGLVGVDMAFIENGLVYM